MKRALGRRIREILGRVRSTGDAGPADSPSLPEATGERSQPRRDVAVVIPTPLHVPPGVDAPPLGRLLVERRATRPQDITLAVMQQGEGDERPLGEILVDHGATTAAHVVEALEHQAEAKRAAAASSVRVDVVLLEALAQLAAELVETCDQVRARAGRADDPAIVRLDHVCAELQERISAMLQRPINPGRDAGS